MHFLRQAGLTPIEETYEPSWLWVRGQKIALFALNDITAPLHMESAERAIRQAKKKGGWVIVSIHWGMEYHAGSDARQRLLATRLAEAGASLVVGHHPHVLQEIEWIRAEGQASPTLVAYSLGNALFDQPMPDTRRSVVLFVSINSSGVQNWWALPFEIDHPQTICQPVRSAQLEIIYHRLCRESKCILQEPVLTDQPPFFVEISHR